MTQCANMMLRSLSMIVVAEKAAESEGTDTTDKLDTMMKTKRSENIEEGEVIQ